MFVIIKLVSITLALLLITGCAGKNTVLEKTYSGVCGDGVYWMLDTTTGVLTVNGTGNMYDSFDIPWYEYRDSIKSVLVEDGVTGISYNAFAHCKNLISATISEDVTSIGPCAFFNCLHLKHIVIPEGVKEIPDSAFYGCRNLESVTIPDSVTGIRWNCQIQFSP